MGLIGWNPKQAAPKRGIAWYILVVRNAKKEILIEQGGVHEDSSAFAFP
jgi:hypothetical protein